MRGQFTMDSAPPLPVTIHTRAPRKWNNLDFAIMKQILRALRGLIVQDKRCQESEDDAKVCGLKSLCRFMAELHRLGTFFFVHCHYFKPNPSLHGS